MPEGVKPDRVAPPRVPRLGYIPALDGLRAIAVVAVLLYHGNQDWIPGGFLGVDVFFVISGYLITSLLLADWREHGKVQLRRFWFRRARRLLPALYTMLAVVSIYSLLFLHEDVAKLRGQVIAAVLYVENWYLIFQHQSYFQSVGRPPLLQNLWSLAVEEQFYLVFPLLLGLGLAVWGTRSKRLRLIIAILGVAFASFALMWLLYVPYTDPSRVYYGTDTRVGELLIGAALAFVWAPWRLNKKTGRGAPAFYDAAGVVAIAVLCWFFLNTGEFQPSLYHTGFLMVALVSAVTVAVVVHPAARLAPWVLGLAVFKWIGVRSYAIYLWHWPVYMITRPHSDIPLTGYPLLSLRLGITFVLAELSFRYVEEPIRSGAIGRRVNALRRSHGEVRRRLATGFALTGAALLLVVVIVTVGLFNAKPEGRPAGVPAAAAVLITPSTTATTAAPGPAPVTTAPTTLPPLVGGRITAVGDSVMLGAAPAMQAVLGPNLYLDAKESRQFSAGLDLVRDLRMSGQLGDEIVVQLGTNGTIDPSDFDAMMQLFAGAKRVVILNAKVPRPWEQEVNDTLSAGIKNYKNAVLLDWHDIGTAHPEYFYNDQIHLNPDGQQAYAAAVAAALG
jgi:peptidoglycan/LPS O-acetylase OafA/YrhL